MKGAHISSSTAANLHVAASRTRPLLAATPPVATLPATTRRLRGHWRRRRRQRRQRRCRRKGSPRSSPPQPRAGRNASRCSASLSAGTVTSLSSVLKVTRGAAASLRAASRATSHPQQPWLAQRTMRLLAVWWQLPQKEVQEWALWLCISLRYQKSSMQIPHGRDRLPHHRIGAAADDHP